MHIPAFLKALPWRARDTGPTGGGYPKKKGPYGFLTPPPEEPRRRADDEDH